MQASGAPLTRRALPHNTPQTRQWTAGSGAPCCLRRFGYGEASRGGAGLRRPGACTMRRRRAGAGPPGRRPAASARRLGCLTALLGLQLTHPGTRRPSGWPPSSPASSASTLQRQQQQQQQRGQPGQAIDSCRHAYRSARSIALCPGTATTAACCAHFPSPPTAMPGQQRGP